MSDLCRPVPSAVLLKRAELSRRNQVPSSVSHESTTSSRSTPPLPSSSSTTTTAAGAGASSNPYESHGERLERENRKLKEELERSKARVAQLEELTSTLLVRRALPPFEDYLPPFFLDQYRDVLAGVDVYASQYHERVRHLLREGKNNS